MAQLMLLFRAGTERYALETTSIVEIIHSVKLTKVYGSPPVCAGRFNYHGKIITAFDLSQFLSGTPSQPALGTRIVIVKLAKSDHDSRLLGLLVEQATTTLESHQYETTIEDTGESKYPYLGRILIYQQAMIQCLKIEELLSELINYAGSSFAQSKSGSP